MIRTTLFCAILVAISHPAWASDQTTSMSSPPPSSPSTTGESPDKDTHKAGERDAAKQDADPNRVICRRQEVLGSRLAKKKICATASEWARINAEERQATERIQNQRSKSN